MQAGIIAYLDEECLLGKGSDATFLEKLESNLKQNPYFERPRDKGKAADDFSQFGSSNKHERGLR